jgi:arylamine N-acetyltransferase
LWSLLRHLGFDALLCGADMVSGPDVHIVILARVDDHDYWVDAGYAAPFFEPLRADLQRDQTLRHGRDHYVLRGRDADGRSRLDHFRNGERIHGYLAKPIPRSPGHFQGVIHASYADSATFMNALAVMRYHDDGSSVAVYNDRLIRSTADACSVTRLPDREAIVHAVEGHCGIPADIVREATSGLVELWDVHPAR